MPSIKFTTNVPVEVRLHSITGELVDSQFGGQQYKYSSDAGAFWVSEVVGNVLSEQIKRQGITAGELVSIVKAEVARQGGRKGIEWRIERVNETAGREFPAASPAQAVKPMPVVSASQSSRPAAEAAAPRWAQTLTAQTKQLLDVYAELVQYASAKHGNGIRPDDIRALLTTTFINLSKGGNANAA
jgi:hypothetical protein